MAAKETHPLYHSWGWMKKMDKKQAMSDEWKDFWTFVKDMGDRPSPKHQLYRLDKEKGYSKENCVWKEAVACSRDRTEYAREWRKQNPDKVKNSELKKYHGLDLNIYKDMLENQNHVCAICSNPETVIINDNLLNLAVDHCHATGKIRGLLCVNCNKMLGHSKDNREVLQKAITYLTQFQDK